MKLNLNSETIILIEIFIVALLVGLIFNINNKPSENFQGESKIIVNTKATLDYNERELRKLRKIIEDKIENNKTDTNTLDLLKKKYQNTVNYKLTSDMIKHQRKLINDIYKDSLPVA